LKAFDPGNLTINGSSSIIKFAMYRVEEPAGVGRPIDPRQQATLFPRQPRRQDPWSDDFASDQRSAASEWTVASAAQVMLPLDQLKRIDSDTELWAAFQKMAEMESTSCPSPVITMSSAS